MGSPNNLTKHSMGVCFLGRDHSRIKLQIPDPIPIDCVHELFGQGFVNKLMAVRAVALGLWKVGDEQLKRLMIAQKQREIYIYIHMYIYIYIYIYTCTYHLFICIGGYMCVSSVCLCVFVCMCRCIILVHMHNAYVYSSRHKHTYVHTRVKAQRNSDVDLRQLLSLDFHLQKAAGILRACVDCCPLRTMAKLGAPCCGRPLSCSRFSRAYTHGT